MVISLSVSSAPYKDDIHSVILLSLLVPHIEEMDLGFYVGISRGKHKGTVLIFESLREVRRHCDKVPQPM